MDLNPTSWADVWELETPLLELFARALVLYLGTIVFLRVMPRRTGGELATMDLVLLLLIAEAASHAFGEYQSLGDGLVMIALIMGLNYALNALSFRFPMIERLISNPPIPIIRDGRMLPRNMRREFLTEEELHTYLRKNDISDISEVKYAFVEGEGQVTFVTRRK